MAASINAQAGTALEFISGTLEERNSLISKLELAMKKLNRLYAFVLKDANYAESADLNVHVTCAINHLQAVEEYAIENFAEAIRFQFSQDLRTISQSATSSLSGAITADTVEQVAKNLLSKYQQLKAKTAVPYDQMVQNSYKEKFNSLNAKIDQLAAKVDELAGKKASQQAPVPVPVGPAIRLNNPNGANQGAGRGVVGKPGTTSLPGGAK